MTVTLAVVIGGAVNVYFRTRRGSGGATDIGWDDAAILGVVAIPSLAAVVFTRNWRIWNWECLLAFFAWILFLGPAGDLSCVDCGFALLIPVYLAGPQAILFIVALLSPQLRAPIDD